jgi:hypothetical protein
LIFEDVLPAGSAFIRTPKKYIICHISIIIDGKGNIGRQRIKP